MEKDPPPPYSSEGNYPPPGFLATSIQPQGNQGYPPSHVQPAGYPPPAQGFSSTPYQPVAQGFSSTPYQPIAQGTTTVLVTSIPLGSQFGPTSQPMTCPYCHHQITTRITAEPAMKTHLFALILCFFGCIPCCLLPYCIDSCQNQNHYCPQCNAFLGAYDGDRNGPYRRY